MEMNSSAESRRPCIFRRHKKLVEELRSYLLRHLDRKVKISELAEHCGVSETLVKSCFREVCGQTIHVWFRHQKMLAAAKALESTERSVLEIAGSLGFENASKFAKVFGDAFGMSPAAYRKSKAAGKAEVPGEAKNSSSGEGEKFFYQ